MEANNTAAMRDALSELVEYLEKEYRFYDTAGNIAAFLLKKFKLREALSAPPRACDVMSKEDLTKVVTNALRHSLAKIPEFTIDWAKSLVEVVVASAIECAYDTKLVVKKEGEGDGSK